ncbi:alpha/beta hydrolase [uncultured Mucilaginibacter sp.]|uniref:alpha/beta hydrolase n=1 Tax=uncultured Mucilaginibacter sp. TaxID=797541 RepID=UPI0025F0A35A|nr:alpha/beta hydrolase [uncultured Mucilaginibacter sp.]
MIRFYLLIIVSLISLLAFLKAPEYHLWLLAIGVTEFPLIFFGISLLLTLTGFWAHKYQMAGTILGVVTMLIFLSPIVRAYWVSKTLKADMAKAFESADGIGRPKLSAAAPFSFWNLFKGSDTIGYRSITYVKYKDTALKLDFYPAQDQGADFLVPKPCVIVVHGGSWAGGDSKQLPELNSYLALKGYNVAAINYRMAPKWQPPAPVEDIQSAIAYLKSHADELHIDIKNFVLLGRSAGAQIATLAAYTINEPSLKGVIDFYGPEDMVWGYSIPSNPLIMDSRKVMEDYIGGTFSKVPQKYFACSPLEFVSKQSPPTLIIHGSNDVLVSPEHSRRLNLKLQQNGIKHYWLKLPWATHGFDYNLNGPGGQLSTFAVATFLKTVCPPTPKGGGVKY